MSKKLKTFTFIPSFLILIIAGSLISCKMSLFSKVEVKASPDIYAPLGEKTLEIKEFVSLEKMENLIGTDNEALVFQYPQNQDGAAANENAPMTFMIYYPIMELPLNLGEYIEGIDLSSFNAAIPEVEFTVPELEGLKVPEQTITVPGSERFAGSTIDSTTAGLVNSILKDAGNLSMEERTINIEGEGLKSLVLAENSAITLTIGSTLESSGVGFAPDIKLVLTDGTEVSFVKQPDGSYKADLGSKEITPGEMVLKGGVRPTGTVSEGDEIPAGGIGAVISVSVELTGFASATVELPEGTNLDVDYNQNWPEEARGLISQVDFEKVTATVNLSGNLPEGNDLGITMSSGAFNIPESTKTAVSGENQLLFESASNFVVKPVDCPIDFKMGITLPGYSEADNTITIKNVNPGDTYSLSGNVEIKADWENVTVSFDGKGNYSGSFPLEGEEPIDLSFISEKIPVGIGLGNIEADIFLSSPSFGEDIKLNFNAYIKANEEEILGTEAEPEKLNPSTSLTLPETNIWDTEIPQSSISMGEKFTDFINKRPENLKVDYSLSADSAVISREAMENLESTTVKMELLVKIPLALKIDDIEESPVNPEEKGINLDVMKLAGLYKEEEEKKDLFGRTGSSTDETINQLLDNLKSLTLTVEYDNKIPLGFTGTISQKDVFKKEVTLKKSSKGTINIELNSDEVKKIMEVYPFSPDINLFLPNGDIVIPEDGAVSFKLYASAATDINYTFDLRTGR